MKSSWGCDIYIIETGVNMEFEAPGDHIEPESPQPENQTASALSEAHKMDIGSSKSHPPAKIKKRLENFKKRLPQGDDSDSSDDENPLRNPMFMGSGQALKADTGHINLAFPTTNTSSADTYTAATEDKASEKTPFVPFRGQGRSLR